METQVTLELRLNNTIFKCALDEKFYNLNKKKAYAIGLAGGVIQIEGKFTLQLESSLVCEDCYKANKDKEGLQLVDPSNLVLPNSPTANSILNNIKKRN